MLTHPKIAAHRGIHGIHQENTLVAILEAEKQGIDMVEFDVQVTRDDQWILYHDERIQPGMPKISDMRYDQIMAYADQLEITIDRLDQVLGQVQTISLNIECKPKSFTSGQKLGELLHDTKSSVEVNVSSFSQQSLKGLRSVDPQFKLSLLGTISPAYHWKRLDQKLDLFSVNPYYLFMWRSRVRTFHQHRIEVHVWNVNYDFALFNMLRIGADVIITDKPVRAAKLRDYYVSVNS